MKKESFRSLLALMVFLTGMSGCGTNVYKGLDSKSSADLKLCLDYGDYACVLNGISESDTDPYRKSLRTQAELQSAGFNVGTIIQNAVNLNFSNQASAATNFSNVQALTKGIDPATLSDATKNLNDLNPTDSNLQVTAAVSNALNATSTIYSNFDTNKDGVLDAKDTALQNAATVATTWNTIKGTTATYNSGVLGNTQASIDFINKAYASGATQASANLSKAATDAQTQLNKVSGASNTAILDGILCLDGGTKSDGTACP